MSLDSIAEAAKAEAWRNDQAVTSPKRSLAALYDEGYTSCDLDEAYEIILALAKIDASLGSILAMNYGGRGLATLHPQAEPHAVELLTALNPRYVCIAVSEPDTKGSDPTSFLPTYTTVEKVGAEALRIKGKKTYVTGNHTASHVVVACKPEGSSDEAWFVVLDIKDMERTGTWDTPGLRATISTGLEFDVEVPEDRMIVRMPHFIPGFLGIGAPLSFGVYTMALVGSLHHLLAICPEQVTKNNAAWKVTKATSLLVNAASRFMVEAEDPQVFSSMLEARMLACQAGRSLTAGMSGKRLYGPHPTAELSRVVADVQTAMRMPPNIQIGAPMLQAVKAGQLPF